jgi:hypothetical protein
MPWEEDMPLQDMPLLEGDSTKAGNASSYSASIGLEISGSREFVTDACALVLEFRDIFSTELSPEPADLPPLDVPIDTAKWHQPRNQGRPRNQSVEGQQEIKRHLEKLHTKEKRLVLDYRALNECVGHMNWPLPNISHMIEKWSSEAQKVRKIGHDQGLLAVGSRASGAASYSLYYLDGNLCME